MNVRNLCNLHIADKEARMFQINGSQFEMKTERCNACKYAISKI